jgi:hypothetical protein
MEYWDNSLPRSGGTDAAVPNFSVFLLRDFKLHKDYKAVRGRKNGT